MNLGIVAALAYGILAIIGGIIGYIQVQSKASLISGIISGALLIIGGVIQLQGQTWGLLLATVVTVGLIIVFGMRLTKTGKFMPAGLMAILGLAALVIMLKEGLGA
jgi:uncharacterized membrane protein (UPF0136 family)